MSYDFKKIEKKWQTDWEKKGMYRADDTSEKPKWYSLVEFPYPSGDGLHVGHIRSYTAMDIISRKRRMQGFNVLYPMGWDAFGLPTENYAIKTGIAPAIVTKKNTDTFRRQLKSVGFSFDWKREINTSDPNYYRWTQWMFIQLFKKGLAYKASVPINWCPSCKIGLANEEAVGGVCDRCGGPVEKRNREQWMVKITAYADALLEGLKETDFLPQIKAQQEHWIGRSEGVEIDFKVTRTTDTITVFTTRPDTIMCVTYLVLAPEYEGMDALKKQVKNIEEVERYIEAAKRKTEMERTVENKEKTGVPLMGVSAFHPITKEELPIWVSDYVIAGYGTGAVMAVPAHDERDRAFAKVFDLRIADEMLLSMDEATYRVSGRKAIRYKLRDWVFSRQRYWGEPIPIVFCPKCGYVPVAEKDLPVKLPEVKNYQPRDDGRSPLASVDKWVRTKCPSCGGIADRETDVMPNWAGSSWYFLRYTDAKNKKLFADPKKLTQWMPVDWYNGGMEHVTLHLLYSRFWNRFLRDIGVVPMAEPYKKRTAHGLILAQGGVKMSKSKGNVITPDAIVKSHGADALRLYEMFMGPFDQAIAWDSRGIEGLSRFLAKVISIANSDALRDDAKDEKLESVIERTVKKVGEDIESMAFNTAVSAMMVAANEMARAKVVPRQAFEKFLLVLAPFAPHITEELWSKGAGKKARKTSIHLESWPTFDKSKVHTANVAIAVQVNGKHRETMTIVRGSKRVDVEKAALALEKVVSALSGKKPAKVIFIPDRVINFVL